MEAFIEFRTGNLGHTANAFLSEDGKTVTVSFTFHLKIYTFDAEQFWKHLATIPSKCFDDYCIADKWFVRELLRGLTPLKIDDYVIV